MAAWPPSVKHSKRRACSSKPTRPKRPNWPTRSLPNSRSPKRRSRQRPRPSRRRAASATPCARRWPTRSCGRPRTRPAPTKSRNARTISTPNWRASTSRTPTSSPAWRLPPSLWRRRGLGLAGPSEIGRLTPETRMAMSNQARSRVAALLNVRVSTGLNAALPLLAI